MKYTIIPKGYKITVTTWENDGDNYNTKSIDGLTESSAKFYVGLMKLFNSCHDESPGLGNIYDPNEFVITKTENTISKYINDNLNILPEGFESNNSNYWYDILFDLSIMSGEFYTRVVESIKVDYIPEEIKFEDVTEKFI